MNVLNLLKDSQVNLISGLFLVVGSLVGLLVPIALNYYLYDNLAIYLVSILVINFLFVYHYSSKISNSSISSPVLLFVFFFTLYTITLPIDVWLKLSNKISLEGAEKTLFVYLLADMFLILGVCLGSSSIVKKRVKSVFVTFDKSHNFIAIVIILIGLVMMVYEQVRLGGISTVGIANRLEAFKVQRELQGSTLSLPWKSFLVAGTTWLAANITNKGYKKLLMFIGILCTFFFLGLGSRNLILILLLPVLGIALDRNMINITRTRLILIIVSLLVLMSPLFTNFRDSIINDYNISELPRESWAFSQGETGASFYVTNEIIHDETYYGAEASYVTGIAYALPSSLYKVIMGESKPLNLSDWFVWRYLPYTYKAGGGLGFSPVAQAWMNGHFIGVCTAFFLIGFLLVYFERRTFLKYIILPLVWLFQRIQFNAIFYEFLLISILLILILVGGTILRKVSK